MWYLCNISLQWLLVNPRKAACGVRYGKFKHLSKKKKKKKLDNSLAILHSQKGWSIVSLAFLQNEHVGEDDLPKNFLFK